MVVCGALAAAATALVVLRRWAVWWWLGAVAVLPVVLVAWLGDVGATSVVPALLCGAAAVVALWRAAPPAILWSGALALVVAGGIVFLVEDPHPWWPGPLGWACLAVPLVVGLAAAAGLGRARGSRARLVCALPAIVPAALLVATAGDAVTAVLWWPVSGALGLTALLRGRRGAAALQPQTDDVDRAALDAFFPVDLAPVAIVIAAYNEADGIPEVLERLPKELCGLDVDVVVVDDGSRDDTVSRARATGRAHVVTCGTNRGQGAALRLGYGIARSHGAAYVVTSDADGQYDVADLPAVLQPVVDGRADFVTGSRRLGALHNRDRVRQLGTYVFAWLASALLGQWLTDTSFGLRAMRADVTAEVTLNQPQYQASELLVGVASHGFRILEVPATMHQRAAGASKKGGNLVYGSRYARVMLGTWLREGAPRPLAEAAPALGARGVRRGQPAP